MASTEYDKGSTGIKRKGQKKDTSGETGEGQWLSAHGGIMQMQQGQRMSLLRERVGSLGLWILSQVAGTDYKVVSHLQSELAKET